MIFGAAPAGRSVKETERQNWHRPHTSVRGLCRLYPNTLATPDGLNPFLLRTLGGMEALSICLFYSCPLRKAPALKSCEPNTNSLNKNILPLKALFRWCTQIALTILEGIFAGSSTSEASANSLSTAKRGRRSLSRKMSVKRKPN